jgi:transposase
MGGLQADGRAWGRAARTGNEKEREIVADFQAMIRRRAPAELDPWIERAKTSLVAALASGVTKDKAAVSAAISSDWSNGQTEGQICKLNGGC